MQTTKRTTRVASNSSRGCEHCGASLGHGGGGSVSDDINHFIEEHGYRLLHVGTETSPDPEGHPWHATVAILGHEIHDLFSRLELWLEPRMWTFM